MKKLQYLLVCILIFTIVACSSKNNDITNPISNANLNDNNGNNAKIITTSYTIIKKKKNIMEIGNFLMLMITVIYLLILP